MKTNRYIVFAAAILVGIVFLAPGCASKKHLIKIDEQGVQIQKSQEKIAELQKSNEAVTVELKETKLALDQAKVDGQKASDQLAALNSQVSAVQSKNDELAKSMEAAQKDSDGKIRRLNGQIFTLRKQLTESEEQAAAKTVEITGLQGDLAALKETVAARDQQLAASNGEKTALADEMNRKVSGKNTLITILLILLGLAIIAAVFAFVRRGKQP